MYVKVYAKHNNCWEPWCLLELSKTELKHRKRDYPNQLHLVCTGREAHAWVRKGGVHGTGLYIDQYNSIRRAR